MPSGRFGANAAWLAVIAHNLARWTSRLGLGERLIATDTLRRRYLRDAGAYHLPQQWRWAGCFDTALANLRRVVVLVT